MKRRNSIVDVIAVSGGADSVYLACTILKKTNSAVLAHLNHGARGMDSVNDREFVERFGRDKGMPVEVRRIAMAKSSTGFENRARKERYAFLQEVKKKHGAAKVLVAHTADDQVETIIMRILEGAGISGLKGIPRASSDGIERPLLDTWREDILKYLHKHKIPYRVDKSNFDTRFERNWIRHVLIPLLEKRYGKSVKKRIYALGERFREVDEFLEAAARKWMKGNLRGSGKTTRGKVSGECVARIPRKKYSTLPSALRMKILQLLCFERIGKSPNERLLDSMDRILLAAGPSARLNIGKDAALRCRYDQATLEIGGRGNRTGSRTGKRADSKKRKPARTGVELLTEEKGRISTANLKRLAKGEYASAFDGDGIRLPLSVRPLKAGDRIRPFGLDAEKKVKEILIDRKVPREERWGRPVVCDALGTILWIPGVVRSAHAPLTGKTRRTAVLRVANKRE